MILAKRSLTHWTGGFLLLFCISNLGAEANPLTPEGIADVAFGSPLVFERGAAEHERYRSHVVSFQVHDAKQYALLSLPRADRPENGRPLIILLHGHIPYDRYSTENSYRGVFHRYADSEFAVIKPDLRGHGKSEAGKAFEPRIALAQFPEDIVCLLNSLASYEEVDLNNVFLVGHSNGGDLALRLMGAVPGKIRGVSFWAPVTEDLARSRFFYRGGGLRNYGLGALSDPRAKEELEKFSKEIDEALVAAGISGIEDIRVPLNRIDTPFLLHHGDADRIVPYQWSLDFLDRMNRVGKSGLGVVYSYSGDDHNLSRNQRVVQKRDLEFFRSLLES